MSVIAPGTPAPEFQFRTEDGEDFTRADLVGQTTILVFYPFAFSPVCTDQLQVYEEALGEIEEQGARIFGVSTDASYAQKAFRESLNVTIPQLSDFEPKGDASRAFGVFFTPGGMSTRALVLTADDGTIAWSWEGEHPGIMPPVSLVLDAVADLGW